MRNRTRNIINVFTYVYIFKSLDPRILNIRNDMHSIYRYFFKNSRRRIVGHSNQGSNNVSRGKMSVSLILSSLRSQGP